ncbi:MULTISPECIES: glutamine synthetase family protein [Rhodobacterales]|uniref:glutamine synthetase family protein n=1 Tax=Roseobacter sp. N2S TaxID=2663844 RepID=UPI002857F01B|nr:MULTISPECIES: glutamine synthetase family protein [Rhodobacterales]MDR6264246.1 glutamine synthetase [Roseobacter sp. N2S]
MDERLKWIEKIPQAAQDYIADRRLEEIECIIADTTGISRGKCMPARKFGRLEPMYLPDSIFYQTVTGSYVDMDEIDNQYTEGDMVLTPDFSSATAAPWTGDVTLQIIHDVADIHGNPMPLVPRNVLKRVLSYYEAEGWEPVVAPEMEFFLVARNTDYNQPIQPTMGRTGRPAASMQAYSMSAVDEYGPVIDDIYDFAEEQGFEIDTIIQEGGAGQVEINLKHGHPLKLADEVFFFKRLVKEAALRHNCYATFMAKPMGDQPGSAMHIHHSVLDKATGKNIFNTTHGKPTPAFRHFIAGLQQHLPAATPFIAPYVNSYRRYVASHSAPINLEWAENNRTTGIRIPLSDPESRRVENRVAGMDCNPYIGLAASLACGFLGLKNKLKPRIAATGEAYDAERDIPPTQIQALALLDEDEALTEMMGVEFTAVYKAAKHMEYDEFQEVISPWEREHLLMNV